MYRVVPLRPLSLQLVTFDPTTATTLNSVPSVDRSMVNPCSPVVLSVHVRATCVSDSAVAVAEVGAAGGGGGTLAPTGPVCQAGAPYSNAPMSGAAPTYPSVYGASTCPA